MSPVYIGRDCQGRGGLEVVEHGPVLRSLARFAAPEVLAQSRNGDQHLHSRYRFHLSSPAAYAADCCLLRCDSRCWKVQQEEGHIFQVTLVVTHYRPTNCSSSREQVHTWLISRGFHYSQEVNLLILALRSRGIKVSSRSTRHLADLIERKCRHSWWRRGLTKRTRGRLYATPVRPCSLPSRGLHSRTILTLKIFWTLSVDRRARYVESPFVLVNVLLRGSSWQWWTHGNRIFI